MANSIGFISLNTYALIMLLLIFIIFLSKKRLHFIEDNTYLQLVIETIITTVVGIILGIAITPSFNLSLSIIHFLDKLYLVCLMIWGLLLTYYTFFISRIKSQKNTGLLIFLVIGIIISMIALLLPINVEMNDNGAIASGLALYFTFAIISIEFLCMLIFLIMDRKHITKKYIPIFLLVVLGTIDLFIQMMFPSLNYLLNPSLILIIVIMYFTIENPDVAVINELNIAKDQAVKANDAKTDFLSSMSHEIRTPLNAIVGFSESLKEEQLSSEAKEEVSDIIDASNTLLEIVNGILDISKIEANKIEIVNSEYSFKKIFNELVALSKARLGEAKPIEFRYKIDESIPDTLYGDYARIKQIILNLLTNSIKYTNEGYIDFQVNSIINENVCRLIVSVEDSGIGIKKESINKLFTKFERLDEKNTTIEGTGLGLAITKKLVEMMNGKIVVQSMYGKGSKFTVIIDQKIMANQVGEVRTNQDEDVIKEYPNKKVLIVDDNQLNLKVAARLLRCYKCQVEEVDSGFKTIDLIASNNHYDLILMDDMMPKLSGIDTFHRLKENPLFNTPVVALTANAISGMREKYLGEGFDEYLAKPIEKNELNIIINKFLG